LTVSAVFSEVEGLRIRDGHIPKNMDDMWFVYFEDGWLNFHRSWTGAHIFALRLEISSAGVRVVDAWASRDEAQYRSPGVDLEQNLVVRLIRLLLTESTPPSTGYEGLVIKP
jgi:hypothetical protein